MFLLIFGVPLPPAVFVALAPISPSVVVYSVGSFFLPYACPAYTAAAFSVRDDSHVNRYIWRSDVRDRIIDGSPRVVLSYSAFINEGFILNNCVLEDDSVRASFQVSTNIFHFDEVLGGYGYDFWQRGPHSAVLRRVAEDYYSSHPPKFSHGCACLSDIASADLSDLLAGESSVFVEPLAFQAV